MPKIKKCYLEVTRHEKKILKNFVLTHQLKSLAIIGLNSTTDLKISNYFPISLPGFT